jgi:hypothetical protein
MKAENPRPFAFFHSSRYSRRKPAGVPARVSRWRPRLQELETRTLPSGASLSGLVFQALDSVDPSRVTPGAGIMGIQINAIGKLPGDSFNTVTNSTGNYAFTNLLPADTYQVSAVLPTGFWGFSAGSDSATVTLSATSNFANLNFGLTPITTALMQNFYQRIMVRSADAGGLNDWVSALNNKSIDIGQAFNGFVTSPEFLSRVSPMTALLLAFAPTNQPPDSSLLRYNVRLTRTGVTPDAAALNILYSQQFVNEFGDTSQLNNTQFVTFLYNTVLHRAPDAGGLADWVTNLNSGAVNRGQVAILFANSIEYTTKTNPRAFDEIVVNAAYQGLLGRPADASGFKDWVNFVATGASFTQLGDEMAASPEFHLLHGFTDPFLSDVQAQPLTPPVNVLSRLAQFDASNGSFDMPLGQSSIAGTTSKGKPVNLYIIAHGWAPGYLQDVLLHSTPGNPLKVWDTVQFPGGLESPEPDSPWLFGGVDQVSVTGLARSITLADANAIVLAYSWIDQSATAGAGDIGPSNLTALLGAGQSESYTQLNGLRLAEAVQLSLNANFFPSGGMLHVLGHSHGSKVATVGALALQMAGIPVAQLTTLESPEDGPSPKIDFNGQTIPLPPQHLAGLLSAQNFLWFYMQQMNVNANSNIIGGADGRTPIAPTGGQIPGQFPTYIDNYFSQDGFGSALGDFAAGTGTPLGNPQSLANIADVNLHPEIIYPLPTDLSNLNNSIAQAADTLFGSHDYPPAWYGQASLMSSPQANGIAWSPLVNPTPASGGPGLYTQDWTSYNFEQQYHLTGPSAYPTPTPTPAFSPFQYAQQYKVGAVQDNGTGTITLGTGASTPLSFESLTFQPLANSVPGGASPVGTGLSFQFQFQGAAQPGDQLVIWVRGLFGFRVPNPQGGDLFNTGTLGYQTIPLFTMSAVDAGTAKQLATISLDSLGNQNGLFFNGNLANGMLGATQQPQLGISLIHTNGSTSTVTVSNMQQFTDGSA